MKPECKLLGQNGNIFNLMSIASRTLKAHGMEDAAKEMQNKIFNVKSYDEALCILMEYVEVV